MGSCKVNGNFLGISIMGSRGYEKKSTSVTLCTDLNVYYFNLSAEELGTSERLDLAMPQKCLKLARKDRKSLLFAKSRICHSLLLP